ncbi:MAG TPA: hypothetical protein VI297_03855, partial [Gemmatimonadales bacterium]
MTRALRIARAAFIAALILLPLASRAERFAVIAGNDHGDAGRPRLWFAEKDAERMYKTLRELGEFDPEGIVLL